MGTLLIVAAYAVCSLPFISIFFHIVNMRKINEIRDNVTAIWHTLDEHLIGPDLAKFLKHQAELKKQRGVIEVG